MKFKYYVGHNIIYIPNVIYKYEVTSRDKLCHKCYFNVDYTPFSCSIISFMEIDGEFTKGRGCLVKLINDEGSYSWRSITKRLKFSLFLSSLIKNDCNEYSI